MQQNQMYSLGNESDPQDESDSTPLLKSPNRHMNLETGDGISNTYVLLMFTFGDVKLEC
jgi:hypothetical protein